MSVYVGHGAAVNPLLAGDELEQVIHDQVGRYPTAGMLGGLTVVTADLLGRMLFAPIEIPAGVITAAVGAPYFLYLLYRHRH